MEISVDYPVNGKAYVADSGEMEDYVEVTIKWGEGSHVMKVYTAKYNCGAYDEICRCSCGSSFANKLNGCWQQSHQREEVSMNWDEEHENMLKILYK